MKNDFNQREQEILSQFSFNDEKFITDEMIKVFELFDAPRVRYEDAKKDAVVKAILKIAVDIDKEKLEKWLERNAILDRVEESELIDIAISKRIRQLKNTIKEKDVKIQEQKERIEELENELIDANEQIDMLEFESGE